MGSSPAAGQASPAPDPPEVDREALESAVRDLLGALGEDVRREGIVDTPKRVAKAMAFAVRGYGMSAVAHVESALFHEQGLQDDEAALADARARRGAGAAARAGEATGRAVDAVAEAAAAETSDDDADRALARPGVVLIRDVPFFSTDETTLLPFYGVCHVGYVPSGGTIVGLSKVARVAEVFARRVQTPDGLARDVARALQQGASPRGVRVVVAGSQMAPTGPRPVFADAAIGCLATEKADGEEERDAREYRAEFRAMLHAGVGAGECPPVGLTGLAGQSAISGNEGERDDVDGARRAVVPAKRRRAEPSSGAGASDANTASDDGSVDAHVVLCAACGGTESAGGQSGSLSTRRRSDASGSGQTERRAGDAASRGSPGIPIPGVPGDAHPRGLSLLLRDSGSRPATPTPVEAGKTQPEGSPAESAETAANVADAARDAGSVPVPVPAPDAAVAAAERMTRALGLDRLMDPARAAAAARAYAAVMAASAQGHAMPLRAEASESTSAASPSGGEDSSALSTFFERDLELATLCEHHLLPFHGAVHVAYLADAATKPLTRAEAQRAVARHGRRFQVQERLTRDIARDVLALTGAPGVMVAVRASHLCMIARGVEKPGSTTVTSAALGAFADNASRRGRFWETLAENAR
jgi:GTP cyclohydrolase I